MTVDKPRAGAVEDDVFNKSVEDLRKMWSSVRFTGIKRPYTAEDVATKRGTLEQVYPSTLMARKLFKMLLLMARAKKPIHTSECYAHRGI